MRTAKSHTITVFMIKITDDPNTVFFFLQLNEHKLKLLSDRIIADNHLKKKLGQLLYLKNLAKVS